MYRETSHVHILRDVTCRYRLQLLMHHGNTLRHRIIRVCNRRLLAIQVNFTFIHVIDTEKALHQCGLSGTIFSHECVNCTRANSEVSVIQRFYTGE